MPPVTAEPDTLADVLHVLGDVPPHLVLWLNLGAATEEDYLELRGRKLRVELVDGVLGHKGISREVLTSIASGTATEEDVGRLADGEPKRLIELADGVLVEKPIRHDLRLDPPGLRSGEDAGGSGRPGRHRPDGGQSPPSPRRLFAPWDRLPSRTAHLGRVAGYPIDLAVEILSDSNTRAEMAAKRREYFGSAPGWSGGSTRPPARWAWTKPRPTRTCAARSARRTRWTAGRSWRASPRPCTSRSTTPS